MSFKLKEKDQTARKKKRKLAQAKYQQKMRQEKNILFLAQNAEAARKSRAKYKTPEKADRIRELAKLRKRKQRKKEGDQSLKYGSLGKNCEIYDFILAHKERKNDHE